MIDSIGGCGDVNRNVLCNPNPVQSALHTEVYQWARSISEALLPKTRAYHEIWLDGEQVEGGESEPLYGDTYLPRKFKTAVAVPPYNDVDVYTNDLGFVAITESNRLVGFNVLAGGGMGTTHGDSSTFPRLADELGFVTPDQVIAVAEAVVAIQRDHGNRSSRRHARLKYTIESMGADNFRREVEQRSGIRFASSHKVNFQHQGDRFGWVQGSDRDWHLTLYIENGRVADLPDAPLMSGLRKIAALHQGDFRITPSQNLIIAGVSEARKNQIDEIARSHGLLRKRSKIRLNSIACVALPTCPQAMAEAERCFPAFISQIEQLAANHGLKELGTVIRMTGCPNGCARPFVAEVGLIGKGPGSYNLMLGGDGRGLRLNRLYRENLKEAEILEELNRLFERYAAERLDRECFGDFTVRAGLVPAVVNPAEDFHV
jgi:sulfite reductase (NADPH) hemoprotein beta-component